MKQLLLTVAIFCGTGLSFAQNINDHKMTFNYIQLPNIKIDNSFDQYELKVEHDYLSANEDSTTLHKLRQDAAIASFHELSDRYHIQRDSLDRSYLQSLSAWEKAVNAGTLNADGSPMKKPNPPVYPEPPAYPNIPAPILHSPYDATNINQLVSVEGFEEGMGGIVISISIQPIQHLPIVRTTKGTGATLKNQYKAPYILPIGIKVQSPTQGIILEKTLFTNTKYYNMPDRSSHYDHELYMLDNHASLYSEIETYARNAALNSTRTYLNNEIGFVTKARSIEAYSVKKFKDYDYSDVTDAYTKMTLALVTVKNDRDRSGAEDKIEEALEAFNAILEESNTYDNKARINDKITAMIQCNIAELLVWKADFDKAEGIANIALNSGEGKAKRHIRDEMGFYADQRKRWEANY